MSVSLHVKQSGVQCIIWRFFIDFLGIIAFCSSCFFLFFRKSILYSSRGHSPKGRRHRISNNKLIMRILEALLSRVSISLSMYI